MKFTHYGSMLGVPCLFDFTDEECPDVVGRYFWCDFALDCLLPLFDLYCAVMTYIDPTFNSMYPLCVKGEFNPPIEVDEKDDA